MSKSGERFNNFDIFDFGGTILEPNTAASRDMVPQKSKMSNLLKRFVLFDIYVAEKLKMLKWLVVSDIAGRVLPQRHGS